MKVKPFLWKYYPSFSADLCMKEQLHPIIKTSVNFLKIRVNMEAAISIA